MRRRLVPRLIAGLVALAGMLALLGAVLGASALTPAEEIVGSVTGVTGAPAIEVPAVTLDADGPRVRVEIRGPAVSTPVFVGIGRADDVEAYLGSAARTMVTGADSNGNLHVTHRSGDVTMPDPAGVDVWATSARGRGGATIVWPDTPGQWWLVAATDGTTDAPLALTLRWTRGRQASQVPALVAVGVVLLVGGVVGLLATRGSKRSRADLDDDDDDDDEDDGADEDGADADSDAADSDAAEVTS